MAFLRRQQRILTSYTNRFFPVGSDEVAPPPTKLYVLKNYDKNPFYLAAVQIQRPLYKKLYNPYQQWLNRRAYSWRPRYKGQEFDMVGPVMLTAVFAFPILLCLACYYEAKTSKFILDPLCVSLQMPKEL